MDDAGQRVRRHVRAARELHGWNQIDLAREANVSRGSVQRLEDGIRLSEGKESKIERALGWDIGSLDQIRTGDRPTPLRVAAEVPTDPELRDIYDRATRVLSHEEAMGWVRTYKSRRDGGASETGT